jgi:hypothetical protein
MSEWIECNLPWYTSDKLPYKVSDKMYYSKEIKALEKILDKKCKEYFGHSVDDSDDSVKGIAGNNFNYDKYNDIIENYIEKNRCSKIDAYKFFNGKILIKDKKSIIITKYRLFNLQYREWLEQQEEYKLSFKLKEEVTERIRKMELQSNPSFCRLGLNNAGTLIEYINVEGEIIQILIGHINELSGVCDDCRQFDNDTIIKRYKIVWNGKK